MGQSAPWLNELSLSRNGVSNNVLLFEMTGANEAAFSSFFFSRNALPPCRRSSPLTDLANVLEGPGEEGAAKEYKGCGALGSVGFEVLLAEDNGKWKSSLSFSLFFCLDKKWCLCFSFSFSLSSGTNVDVDALAEE